jgi:8-oxo-dGTP diphosphatase
MAEAIAMAALVKDGKILLAHRHPGRRWYPDCWDLIGGHIEAGESPEQALRRECREEIAVELVKARPLRIDVSDANLEPHAFLVTDWRGTPVNAAPEEHDAIEWFGPSELPELTLAHPSYAEWLPPLLQ